MPHGTMGKVMPTAKPETRAKMDSGMALACR